MISGNLAMCPGGEASACLHHGWAQQHAVDAEAAAELLQHGTVRVIGARGRA